MMLFDVKKQTKIDVNQSKFNFVNASIIMNLMINLMQKKIVNFVQLLILTFYRVQHKIYRQIVFNLFDVQFEMIFIKIKTINFMQNNEKRLIIMNFIIFQHIEFLCVKN